MSRDDDDAEASFLEACVFSNRAMTSRRCARYDDALEDATRARRVCETALKKKKKRKDLDVRFERLLVKTMCAQADALVNLKRAWEACGVLRGALRRLALFRRVEEKKEEEKNRREDVAVVSARLRFAITRVQMAALCDHWSVAIESAVGRDGVVVQPLSARHAGLLMRPAAGRREDRSTAAEWSRRLRDQLAGAEDDWRAFTADAWIRACAAISKNDDDEDDDTHATRFPFGTGSFARFALYRARAIAHRGKGDVARFVLDARRARRTLPRFRVTKRSLSLTTRSDVVFFGVSNDDRKDHRVIRTVRSARPPPKRARSSPRRTRR